MRCSKNFMGDTIYKGICKICKKPSLKNRNLCREHWNEYHREWEKNKRIDKFNKSLYRNNDYPKDSITSWPEPRNRFWRLGR